MDELELRDILREAIETTEEYAEGDIAQVRTYDEEGVLTNDVGLVLILDGGRAAYITIQIQ